MNSAGCARAVCSLRQAPREDHANEAGVKAVLSQAPGEEPRVSGTLPGIAAIERHPKGEGSQDQLAGSPRPM